MILIQKKNNTQTPVSPIIFFSFPQKKKTFSNKMQVQLEVPCKW